MNVHRWPVGRAWSPWHAMRDNGMTHCGYEVHTDGQSSDGETTCHSCRRMIRFRERTAKGVQAFIERDCKGLPRRLLFGPRPRDGRP